MRPTIYRSSLYIGLGMAVSRAIGFIRDLTVSGHWGVGEFSDSVLMLMNLPDLVTNLLIGTAASALLVPRFVRSQPEQVDGLYSNAMESLTLLAAVVGVVVIVFPSLFVQLIVPGFTPEMKSEFVSVLPSIAAAIILTFAAGTPRAYLQSRENFKVASFENIFYSLPLLVFLLLGHASLQLLSFVIVIAAACRFAYLQYGAHSHGVRFQFQKVEVHARTIATFVSLILSSSAFVVLFFVLRAQATLIGPGQFSLFSYFYKILEVPFGFLSTAVFYIALPRLAGQKTVEGGKNLKKILLYSAAASLVLAVSFKLVSLYEWSFLKLTTQDIASILDLLVVGSLVLPGRLAMSYLQSMEFASQRSRITLVASAIALGASVLILKAWASNLELVALAWIINIYHYVYVAVTLLMQVLVKRPSRVEG